jgi:hypothetical protein
VSASADNNVERLSLGDKYCEELGKEIDSVRSKEEGDGGERQRGRVVMERDDTGGDEGEQ